MADDGLWRIGIFLIIQAVLTPEIRYSAFSGYARPAKEGYSFAAHNHIFKRFYLRCNVHRSASCALNELNHYTRLVSI